MSTFVSHHVSDPLVTYQMWTTHTQRHTVFTFVAIQAVSAADGERPNHKLVPEGTGVLHSAACALIRASLSSTLAAIGQLLLNNVGFSGVARVLEDVMPRVQLEFIDIDSSL